MQKKPKFAILGAGGGGQVMAAHLNMLGYEVNLYEHPNFKQVIDPVIEQGGIYLTGVLGRHFARLNKVTTNMKEAVEGVDIINIVVPAFGQMAFFEQLVPVLEDGQIVIMHPGYLGSIVLAGMLKTIKSKKKVILGESQSLLYNARNKEPAHAWSFGIKQELQLAAFPGKHTKELVEAINPVFPQFIPAKDVLETFLNNFCIVGHPAPTILNAGRIESTKGKYRVFWDGVTESVGRFMESIDEERMRIVEEMGLKRVSCREWTIRIYSHYGAKGDTLREALLSSKNLEYGATPSDLKFTYITQDVPYGLIPMISLADKLDILTPRSKVTVQMACYLNETDYWAEGRTLERLGLQGMDKHELIKFLKEGEQDD